MLPIHFKTLFSDQLTMVYLLFFNFLFVPCVSDYVTIQLLLTLPDPAINIRITVNLPKLFKLLSAVPVTLTFCIDINISYKIKMCFDRNVTHTIQWAIIYYTSPSLWYILGDT